MPAISHVVRVVLHEGRSAVQTMAHHFHRPYEGCRFPVAFRPKAESIRHQALHRNSRNLRESMQGLKRVGERVRAAFFMKISQTKHNSCCLTHDTPPTTAGTA